MMMANRILVGSNTISYIALLITKEVFFRDGNCIGISRACIASEKKKVHGSKPTIFFALVFLGHEFSGSPHVSMPLVDSLSFDVGFGN